MPEGESVTNSQGTGRVEAWFDAFNRVYEALPGASDEPCPNCGQNALHIAFRGYPRRREGYAAFWCSNCLQGIVVSRLDDIPEGVPMSDIRTTGDDEWSASIPNFENVLAEG
jgi:hypothetical protein